MEFLTSCSQLRRSHDWSLARCRTLRRNRDRRVWRVASRFGRGGALAGRDAKRRKVFALSPAAGGGCDGWGAAAADSHGDCDEKDEDGWRGDDWVSAAEEKSRAGGVGEQARMGEEARIGGELGMGDESIVGAKVVRTGEAARMGDEDRGDGRAGRYGAMMVVMGEALPPKAGGIMTEANISADRMIRWNG